MLKSDNRKNISAEASAAVPSSVPPSLLGPRLKIKGEITGTQDLVIHGQFQGKINLKDQNITVARSARVKADIFAKNITIQGTVEGDVQATAKATLESMAEMSGTLSASRISVAEGAIFKGSLKIHTSS